jgi:hypothetical protein
MPFVHLHTEEIRLKTSKQANKKIRARREREREKQITKVGKQRKKQINNK